MLINAQMRYQRLKKTTKGKFVSRFEFEKTKGQLCFACFLLQPNTSFIDKNRFTIEGRRPGTSCNNGIYSV